MRQNIQTAMIIYGAVMGRLNVKVSTVQLFQIAENKASKRLVLA